MGHHGMENHQPLIDLLEQSPLKHVIGNNLHRKSKLEKQTSKHSIDNLLHLQQLQRDQNIEARVASHHRENRGATQIRGGIHVHHIDVNAIQRERIGLHDARSCPRFNRWHASQ